jgi:serine/threonine-protein kinase RsbW
VPLPGDPGDRKAVPDEADLVEVTVTATAELGRLRAVARRLLARRGADEATAAEIVLATQEAVKNSLSFTEAPDACAWVSLQVSGDEAVVDVVDCGRGFAAAGEPEHVRPPDPLDENGRGIFLMRRFMDSIEVTPRRVGTRVRMRRRLRLPDVHRGTRGA